MTAEELLIDALRDHAIRAASSELAIAASEIDAAADDDVDEEDLEAANVLKTDALTGLDDGGPWYAGLADQPAPDGIDAKRWSRVDPGGRARALLQHLSGAQRHCRVYLCRETLNCEEGRDPANLDKPCRTHTLADVAEYMLKNDFPVRADGA